MRCELCNSLIEHGYCEDCGRCCGCSFNPESLNDYCTYHRPKVQAERRKGAGMILDAVNFVICIVGAALNLSLTVGMPGHNPIFPILTVLLILRAVKYGSRLKPERRGEASKERK